MEQRRGATRRLSTENPMTVMLTVYGQTDIGLVRKANEDSFVIGDLTGGSLIQEQHITQFEVGQRGLLLAVSDGMGGHQAGEVASALVVESLRRSMASQAGGASDALLEKATLQANREVWQAAHYPGREHMGATLTALFVHDKTAYIAEVGDSRAYLLRGGEIAQVTRDQSYVQLLVDSGAMSATQAKDSDLSNVVLQAMGLKVEVSAALGKLDLRERDCLVLCSDGLSNKLSADEIRQVILSSTGLDAACTRLVDEAKRRGGEDNITVIVAGVEGDLPPLAMGEKIAATLVVIREFQPAPMH
jgi:serine/threonine protein phosphatase PrpC